MDKDTVLRLIPQLRTAIARREDAAVKLAMANNQYEDATYQASNLLQQIENEVRLD